MIHEVNAEIKSNVIARKKTQRTRETTARKLQGGKGGLGLHGGLDVGVRGSLGGSAAWHMPSAQGMILESWDRVPHWAPCMEPASPSPSACVCASLSVSLMNK